MTRTRGKSSLYVPGSSLHSARGVVEQGHTTAARLAALRASIAHVGRPAKTVGAALPFGVGAVDGHLPGGGLALGALHEVAGGGPDVEHGAAAMLLIAGVLARLPGQVLWVLERPDLFAPALDAVGLHADRVIYAEAGKAATVLLSMEEGLRHAGTGRRRRRAVGPIDADRVAAPATGGGAIRRDLFRAQAQPSIRRRAALRADGRGRPAGVSPRCLRRRCWPHSPETPGLARPRWRLDLLRCRGGEPASWIVEASDATGHLGVPADLADGPAAAPAERRRAAAG